MKDKINIAELLRDCPEGMELDCTMYEDVYFDFVDELNIIHCYIQHEAHKTSITFNQHGTPNSDVKSKCIIFPKGKMTWEGFRRPFKDGDVVATDTGEWIGITTGGEQGRLIPTYCVIKSNGVFEAYLDIKDKWQFCRLATEEEKQKLFKAIKENGYKWNPETKTLEKMTVPLTSEKFYIRIGDIPSEEKSGVYNGDVVVGYEDGGSVYDCIETDGLYRIIMPFPLKEGQGKTYECLIQEITQCRYKIEKPRNVYLVSGMEVGKGYDNEPLIKDVKILKDLTGQFNTQKKNDNTEEAKTLEKLIEPKFKVGDKVRHKGATSCGTVYVIERMKWTNNHTEYEIRPLYDYNHTGLVTLCVESLHRYQEETMEDKGNISDGYHTLNELYEYRMLYNASMFNELAKQGLYDVHKSKRHSDGTIPFGDENWFIVQAELPTGQISNHYEMKDWNLFNVPEKEKANPYDGHTPQDVAKRLRKFLTPKHSYPKTYEKCCKVLCCKPIVGFAGLDDDEENLYGNFIALKRCRDAYWKIAGEQMGLKKSWKPDWTIYEHKFCIGTDKDKVIKECVTTGNRILAFPTEEMRDAFYENFKDLIELCKELL